MSSISKIYKKEVEKAPINIPNNWFNIVDLNYQNCLEKLNSQHWKTLFEFEEEFYRRGIIN